MTRWMKLPLAAAVCLAAMTIASPALADEPCSVLDLTCVAEDTTEDAEGVIDETTDPVGDTTDPIVQPVLDEVKAILGEGGVINPPGGGGGGGAGGGGGGPKVGGGSDGDAGHGGDRTPISSTNTRQQIFDPALGASHGDPRPRGVELARPVSSGGIGSILTGAARSALLILVLLGISLAFLMIQDRLDRNEPKLALARISPDVLGFE